MASRCVECGVQRGGAAVNEPLIFPAISLLARCSLPSLCPATSLLIACHSLLIACQAGESSFVAACYPPASLLFSGKWHGSGAIRASFACSQASRISRGRLTAAGDA